MFIFDISAIVVCCSGVDNMTKKKKNAVYRVYHAKSIIQELLKCYVHMDTCEGRSPMWMCESSHVVCNDCHVNMKNSACGVCRQPRNILASTCIRIRSQYLPQCKKCLGWFEPRNINTHLCIVVVPEVQPVVIHKVKDAPAWCCARYTIIIFIFYIVSFLYQSWLYQIWTFDDIYNTLFVWNNTRFSTRDEVGRLLHEIDVVVKSMRDDRYIGSAEMQFV